MSGFESSATFDDLARGTIIRGGAGALRGRSLLVSTKDHFTAASALLELDGIARRLVLCPPGLPPEHLGFVIASADVDTIISDAECHSKIEPYRRDRDADYRTEWILLTSGTTGRPKLVVHTLASLAGAIDRCAASNGTVWSTFYDIRRYGGLQIRGAEEPVADFLARAGAHEVSHISGTPSQWRRALMDPSARMIEPQYVRLSGEIADQGILDNLRAFYPMARISHAFASTEGGVAFEVTDGLAGFPATVLRDTPDVEMKIENGSLRIRSARTAERYLENEATLLRDPDGFVDTGDLLELHGDRYYFTGRRDGVINVGGLKVHPEEVEAVINRHPHVGMSLVYGRRSSITGSVVVADVVPGPEFAGFNGEVPNLERDILRACREALPRHKAPVTIRFVASLAVAETGKLVRTHA
jgi:acyl-CoA synthetase (AMP-forming)/AMP-acid ligase II